MRHIAVLILLLFFTYRSLSQEKNLIAIEKELTWAYKQVLADRFEKDSIFWERLEYDTKIFKEKMFTYTSNYPGTLSYDFDSLKAINVDVVTSSDGFLRIYSWDTWLGGTMHDIVNIFQFKSGGKVFVKLVYNTATLNEAVYVPFYSQIHTIKGKTKTYYLAISNGMYSSKDCSQSIRVFTIENGSVNDTVKLFKTKTGYQNAIDIDFDFFTVADRPERPVRLIHYDSETKIVYIPIVQENGLVTNRFILYKYNGEYFEYLLTQRNPKK